MRALDNNSMGGKCFGSQCLPANDDDEMIPIKVSRYLTKKVKNDHANDWYKMVKFVLI